MENCTAIPGREPDRHSTQRQILTRSIKEKTVVDYSIAHAQRYLHSAHANILKMPRASKSKVKNDPEYKAASQSGSGELGRWSYEEKLAVVREVIAANIGKVDFKEIHHKIYVEGNQDHAFPARSVKQGERTDQNAGCRELTSLPVRDQYK